MHTNENMKSSLSWLWIVIPALGAVACGEDDDTKITNPPDNDPSVVVVDTYAVTSNNRLVAFNRTSGEVKTATAVLGLDSGDSLVGVDFRPVDADLYALGKSGKLYIIDTETGMATPKSTLSADPADTSAPFATLDGTVFGVNFNPVADRLRVVSSTGQNLRINVDTGATTTDAALNPGTPSVTAAAYSNSFSAACRTRLYVIDTSAHKLLLQDPPNAGTLSELGALTGPAATSQWAGFEVITGADGTNKAIALFAAASGATIYDMDLTNGGLGSARTLALAVGESVRGLSAAPPATAPTQAPGELLGVTLENQIISFNRGAPGKLCTKQPITGLGTNEEVLGIDIRPADGGLYALGSAGKIYTIDVASGAATLKSTLTADANDATQPFTTLPEGEFGVGFNPVPDRLRIVGAGGQNLRVNVETGATTTDAALSPTSMAVNAVAYTNAYAGATSTTLYAVDTAGATLTRIGASPATTGACPDDLGNPNCGNVTALGVLGVTDMTEVNGFDIDGDPAANGTAFLALTVGTATSSSLFVIDLATGAAAPPTGVANPTIGGGVPLRELTLAANPVVPATP